MTLSKGRSARRTGLAACISCPNGAIASAALPPNRFMSAAPHFRTVALIVGAAMFMEQLDGTVLATALPSMARDLGVTAPNMSIALTSYLISLAIFIPVSGKVADRFGN